MDNQTTSKKDKLFSLSLILLACSIAYFAYSLLSISQQIPSILVQVNNINKQIDRTVEEIEPLLVLVPSIVNEVSEIRELVLPALKEVEAVRSTLPSILQRVDKLHTQVEKIIPLIPEVLSEVEKTRNEIPSYLTRVEDIVANSKTISEEAGKGAVTGFFKGIIATPFELIKGTEERIRSSLTNEEMITDEDFKLVSKAVGELLESDQVETIAWENPSSGNKGQITLVNSYQREERECRALLLLFKAKDGSEDSVNRDVCLNDNGKWEALE
jgi:archaellum component FlaC